MKDKDEKILKGLKEGKTQVQISKELGIAASNVCWRIKRMKIRGVNVPTDDRNDKILELLKQGKTQTQIAQELGMKYNNVSYRINKMKEKGINIPDYKREKRENIILNLLEQGKTQEEIGKKLGLAQPTISTIVVKMRKQGIEIPNNGRKPGKKVDNQELDIRILEGLQLQKSQGQIAKELGVSRYKVSYRIKKMRELGIAVCGDTSRGEEENKSDSKKIVEGIMNLRQSKNATKEQLRKMAELYGVSEQIENILKSLEIDER